MYCVAVHPHSISQGRVTVHDVLVAEDQSRVPPAEWRADGTGTVPVFADGDLLKTAAELATGVQETEPVFIGPSGAPMSPAEMAAALSADGRVPWLHIQGDALNTGQAKAIAGNLQSALDQVSPIYNVVPILIHYKNRPDLLSEDAERAKAARTFAPALGLLNHLEGAVVSAHTIGATLFCATVTPPLLANVQAVHLFDPIISPGMLPRIAAAVPVHVFSSGQAQAAGAFRVPVTAAEAGGGVVWHDHPSNRPLWWVEDPPGKPSPVLQTTHEVMQ